MIKPECTTLRRRLASFGLTGGKLPRGPWRRQGHSRWPRTRRIRLAIWLLLVSALLLTTGTLRAAAPKSGRIAGFVVDSADKTPIPQANLLLENTTIGAVSAKNGFFRIEGVPPGTYRLIVTMLGYRKLVINDIVVKAGELRAIRVALKRQAIDMGNVQVQAKREAHVFDYEKSVAGHEIITPRFTARRPGALEDAYRALNAIPGVTSRSDWNTQLYIRGGSPDQNLVLYDGIEITTPSRLFVALGGGISLVNPDINQAIDLEPAGFDASHGGKSSALMQIANREGRRDRTAVSVSLAMVTARAVAEGPIGRRRGSWLIAGRRSFYDLLANTLDSKDYIFPFYYDLHAKAAYDLTRNSRLTAFYTGLGEGARMYNVESEQLDLLNAGRGHVAGLRFNTILSPRTMMNLQLGYYRDHNDVQMFDTYNARYHVDLAYQIERRSVRGEVVYAPRPWFTLKGGGQLASHQTNLNWSLNWRNSLDLPDSIRFVMKSQDAGAFIQLRLQPARWLEWNTGLRYDNSTLYGESHAHPRMRLLLFPKQPLNVWFSYGTYSQFPDFMTVIGRGEPLDISHNLASLTAELANHRILGLLWEADAAVQLKMELYEKEMEKLLVNPVEGLFNPANSGRGIARGIELTLQRPRREGERFGWWANLALAEARYKRYASDSWRYFDYDQRLQAGAGGEWRLRRNWQFSLVGHYSTGFPTTPIAAIQRDVTAPRDPLMNYTIINRAENSARYPDYWRCDLRLSYLKQKPGYTFSAYLDLINLFNRRNVYMYDWRYFKSGDDSDGYIRRSTIYMMPFLPSFGITIAF